MFWPKLLGVILIIGGCGCYGLMSANRLRKRVEQLLNIRLALACLEKEINYLHTPLPAALSRAAQGAAEPARSLFAGISQDLQTREGITINEAWQHNLRSLYQQTELNDQDLELLLVMAPQLGMSGGEEQVKLLTMVQEQLKVQEDRARIEEDNGCKLRVYGGFAFGATVVLLLL